MIFILELIIHYAQFILIMNLYTVVLSSSPGYKNIVVIDWLIVNNQFQLSTITY